MVNTETYSRAITHCSQSIDAKEKGIQKKCCGLHFTFLSIIDHHLNDIKQHICEFDTVKEYERIAQALQPEPYIVFTGIYKHVYFAVVSYINTS